jgi:hypothetical protein
MNTQPMSDPTTDIDALLGYLSLCVENRHPLMPKCVASDYYAALTALVAERNAAIKQRDEAREMYCREAARHSVCRRSIMDARTIARMNGWDCFKEVKP